MLISHRHRFIFFHVPKNAGISIRDALEPFCDVAPFSQWRRLLSHLPVPENPRAAIHGLHTTAAWARRKLPRDMFDGYVKFAVVRNPYERAVSLYHYLSQNTAHHRHERVARLSFYGFLEMTAERPQWRKETQLHCLADSEGRLLIDRTLRLEALEQDFARLGADLGLEGLASLNQLNSSDHRAYEAYYSDPRTLALANTLYAADCKAFGYPILSQPIARPDAPKKVFARSGPAGVKPRALEEAPL